MALDEYLFGKIAIYFKKNKKQSAEIAERMVKLDDIKPRLTLLSRAITGNPIDIYPAEREGGYKNNNFFLPAFFALFPTQEDNLSFYLYRILYLSIQKQLHLNWSSKAEQPLVLSQQKALEAAPKILTALFQEFPITESWHQTFKTYFIEYTAPKTTTDYSWLYGKFMHNDPENNSENTLENYSDKVKNAHENTPTTTIQSKAVEEVVVIEVDKKQQEDYILTHNFEKVETAEEFNGVWRDFDGDDELENHQDALDELNMKFMVRTDDTAHSVYQADFIENTTISESAERDAKGYYLKYDEWDFAKHSYKTHFCKVYPLSLLKTDVNYYQKTMAQYAATLTNLRKTLTNLNNKMQEQRKQTQGDEFDIDAVTDLFTDIHSKHTPSERIYTSKRKKEKDLSILLLLDISLSSDGYADGNRIIDVEKQVSILFGEILDEFNIDFSITGFYSKTRNFSTYQTFKDFDEPWNKAKYVVGAAEPTGYTRIGAALRHSGALLDKRQTKNKWLILISDGKPNDFDKYEGKYGINDVKQALRELSIRQIKAYSLAIEAQAKYYLPQMFGQNHYQILTTPTELLGSLVTLFEKIKYQC